ncbi:MAG: molybdopterin-dependent oxidoreductase, partial [Steroidobacteraceae bacterium]
PDGTVFGIGSPRASLEANFALRALVGPAHFYQGVADAEARSLAIVLQILRQAPAPVATLRDAEQADSALVLGEDLPDTAPRLALALRQMVRHAAFALAARRQIPAWQDASVRDIGHDARSALFIASSDATRLDDVAIPLRAAPPDIVRLGCAVLHALDPSAPAPADLAPAQQQQAEHIAHTLQGAQRPLIIAGVSAGCDALLHTAAAIAGALKRAGRAARMLLTVPECNSLGLALLGGAPLSAALARTAAMAARAGPAATLLVLENDLYRRATRDSVEAALRCARHLVVLDHTLHATARRAELLLPAATFAESSGTLINYEGRAQRFFQLLFPEDELTASWRWLNQAACALDPHAPHWDGLDQVIAAIVTELPALAAIRAAAPDAALRVAGSRVASAPPRESGRTAMYADRSVHEPPPPPNPDAPYTESMEGYYGQMPAALYPFFWSPAWNSEQGLNKFQQEVGGPLRGGPAGAHIFTGARSAGADGGPHTAVGTAGSGAVDIPAAFAARADQWLLIPQYRVFGSDELSAQAPAVAERIGA